jgi:hypothetical protein
MLANVHVNNLLSPHLICGNAKSTKPTFRLHHRQGVTLQTSRKYVTATRFKV